MNGSKSTMSTISDRLRKLAKVLQFLYTKKHSEKFAKKIEEIVKKHEEDIIRDMLVLKGKYLMRSDIENSKEKIEKISKLIKDTKDTFEVIPKWYKNKSDIYKMIIHLADRVKDFDI